MVGGAGDPNHSATGMVLVFSLEKSPFHKIFVSRFHGVFTPKTGFSFKKRPFSLPYGRGRFLPYGRDFGAGDTTLGRPSESIFGPPGPLVRFWFLVHLVL